MGGGRSDLTFGHFFGIFLDFFFRHATVTTKPNVCLGGQSFQESKEESLCLKKF
jgi:hypothetical protein